MRKRQKTFTIPTEFYNEIKTAAKEKGQTVEQYVDGLVMALICADVK